MISTYGKRPVSNRTRGAVLMHDSAARVGIAPAAVVVSAATAAAAGTAVAAAAPQNDQQNDDPAAVASTKTVIAHTGTS